MTCSINIIVLVCMLSRQNFSQLMDIILYIREHIFKKLCYVKARYNFFHKYLIFECF